MSQRHHIRTGSQGRKPLSVHHARPGKAPAIKRAQSYNNNAHPQSHSHPSSQSQSTSRPGTASRKLSGAEERRPLESDCDMSTFLQFCATCERQIVTPGVSILYCSEACRRKDISNPYDLQAPHSPSLSPLTNAYIDYPPTDIIPQRSPTVLPPLSLASSDLPVDADFTNESDESISPLDRRSSEASHSWFRSESDSTLAHYGSARRSRGNRSSTAMDSNHLPSLIHSPSSSYSTVGSIASYRPLPPRHSNPFSTSFSTTKSIDLVLPCSNNNSSSPAQWLKDSSLKSSASTLTSFRVAEASELSYERRELDGTPKQRQVLERAPSGSLKQLFSHDAIKAPPRRN